MCHQLMPRCIVTVPTVFAIILTGSALFRSLSPLHVCGFALPRSIANVRFRRSLFHASPTSILYNKSSTELYEDIDEKSVNDHGVSDTVDRAPCFDGICDSRPIESENKPTNSRESDAETDSKFTDLNESTGGAILRLGTMTGPTVWSEFGRISQEFDVANLGQG